MSLKTLFHVEAQLKRNKMYSPIPMVKCAVPFEILKTSAWDVDSAEAAHRVCYGQSALTRQRGITDLRLWG